MVNETNLEINPTDRWFDMFCGKAVRFSFTYKGEKQRCSVVKVSTEYHFWSKNQREKIDSRDVTHIENQLRTLYDEISGTHPLYFSDGFYGETI